MSKGNPENLIPVRSKNEARKKGKNGGIASGVSRRKKSAEKDCIKMLLNLPIIITKDDVKGKLVNLGVDEEYCTNEMLIAFKLFSLAVGGDLNAIKYIDERTDKNPMLEIKRDELEIKRREIELKEATIQNTNTNVGILADVLEALKNAKNDVEQ